MITLGSFNKFTLILWCATFYMMPCQGALADILGPRFSASITDISPRTVEFETLSGPSLLTVSEASGVSAAVVRKPALDGHAITSPSRIIQNDAPTVAVRQKEKRFGVRDKGPLWLVCPYDSDHQYRTGEALTLSVSKLMAIHVVADR